MTSRPSTAAPILAVLAIVLVTLGAYVGGYFWLGHCRTTATSGATDYVWRDYELQWVAELYRPAAKAESWLRLIDVDVTGPDDKKM
jgi:hypothetical protein